ncbi:MAG: DevR family CRISPR-associated autoregulator, partial [Thermogemmata sp.]|nr:DevR family CRISPR-associated autoregulator [Thermogemmata sp.]
MSLHVFANFVTSYGTAANNRAESEGNITTLQKLIWQGQTHTTVSAEAIRFALRRHLAQIEPNNCNRVWDEEKRINNWRDPDFISWEKEDGPTYIDDDLLGFMSAQAAKTDNDDAEEEEEVDSKAKGRKKDSKQKKGSARVRRAILEVTRAISITSWPGDVTFNAASPDATPSAQKKGTNPVPYGTEVHATRYQYA